MVRFEVVDLENHILHDGLAGGLISDRQVRLKVGMRWWVRLVADHGRGATYKSV